MKNSSKLLTLIVPLIMVIFFIRNVILVETDYLDSWMGGGMRMFGKIDKMLYRVSGMTVMHNDSIYFVNFRNYPELEKIDIESRILPNDYRLQNFYKDLREMEWCYNKENDIIELASKDCTSPIESDKIQEIIVFRTDFEDSSNLISLKPINSYSSEKNQ